MKHRTKYYICYNYADSIFLLNMNALFVYIYTHIKFIFQCLLIPKLINFLFMFVLNHVKTYLRYFCLHAQITFPIFAKGKIFRFGRVRAFELCLSNHCSVSTSRHLEFDHPRTLRKIPREYWNAFTGIITCKNVGTPDRNKRNGRYGQDHVVRTRVPR